MYISSDMLLRGLEGHGLSITVEGDIDGALALARVLFAEEGVPLSDGFVYVAENDEFIKDTGKGEGKYKSVCLISGGQKSSLYDCFETVFYSSDDVPAITLHNIVQRVYERYELWKEELWAVLNAGSDVQAMIDIGTQVIGNPLVLQDSNFSVIAVSSEFKNYPALGPVLEQASAVPLKIMGQRALFCNILQRGRFHYRIMAVEMTGKFHQSVVSLLEFLSKYIQVAIGFVVEEEKEPAALTHVMENVLAGEYKDPVFIEQKLREFNWDKEHEYVCAKLFTQLTDYNNRTIRFMCDRFSMLFPEACIFEYENSVAAFFNLRLTGLSLSEVTEPLTGFLQDNNMKAGMSDVFGGFDLICQYYQQAGEALKLGPRLRPNQLLHFFPDVKELYVLDRCTGKLPAFMVCDQGILKLREYDQKHRQDLYNTYYVYLKNNCKSVSAAKELFIHRSTFLYRLERIRGIMGQDPDNEQKHWYLMLSYKLLEQEEL